MAVDYAINCDGERYTAMCLYASLSLVVYSLDQASGQLGQPQPCSLGESPVVGSAGQALVAASMGPRPRHVAFTAQHERLAVLCECTAEEALGVAVAQERIVWLACQAWAVIPSSSTAADHLLMVLGSSGAIRVSRPRLRRAHAVHKGVDAWP